MTLLAQNVVNVTDTAFLGRVGEVELGASAIAGVFYIAIFMVGFGFSMGSQILIGHRNGEKRFADIGKIFNNGMLFNLLLATLIFVLSMFLMSPILKLIVESENIYSASMDYLNWRIWGLFFSFANVMFRALYVGIANTKVLSISSILTAIANVVFDYVLIFGKFGFPEMGIKGAAIASAVAELVTTAYLVLYTFNKKGVKKYNLFQFSKIDFIVIKKTFDISVFIMFQYFISVSTWFLFFIFIERTGERPLAVSNITRSIYMLLMIPASALGTTVSTMVSNLIGEGRNTEVLGFLKKMIKINLIISAPFVVAGFFFPEFLIKVYTSNSDLISSTVPVVRLVSFSLLVFGTGILLFNSVSATGNTRIAFIFELSVLFFYVIYTYCTTVVFPMQVTVVWGAEYLYWGLIATLSYVYLKYGNWKNIKI
jgi:putative MATE family efflux protein